MFLIGGDFAQLLPVIAKGTISDCVAASIRRSTLWQSFTVFRLEINMRVSNADGAEQFRQFLLDVANNHLNPIAPEYPLAVMLHPRVELTDDIEAAIFPNSILASIDLCVNRAILCSTNKETFEINRNILRRLPGRDRDYFSADEVPDSDGNLDYTTEYLNSETPCGMPPHRLTLKVGAIVMCLTNLAPKNGLCNGTRLVVESCQSRVVRCRIISGMEIGTQVLIPRITTAPKENGLPFTLQRRQFPLRLCYAVTINKSQGQEYDVVGVYLPRPVFSHGQLYVALSRAKSWAGLKLQVVDLQNRQGTIEDRVFTENIVQTQIL